MRLATRDRISRACIGGAVIGGLHGRAVSSEADVDAIYAAAWARGVRSFDTAPRYGAGAGERRLGRALRGRRRSEFRISTKVGITRDVPVAGCRPGAPERYRPDFDYGFDATLRSVDASLTHLGVDRLDAVLIHDVGPGTHGPRAWRTRFEEALDGAFPALARLRREGVIGALGVGVNSCEACIAALAEMDLDQLMVAGRYTLLDQSALSELLPGCAARGVGVVVAAPFSSGVLATGASGGGRCDEGAASEPVRQRVARIEALCRSAGTALGAVALQLPLAHPQVQAVCAGARSAQQVGEIADWLGQDVPPGLWHRLRDDGLIDPRAPLPGDA